MAREILDLFDWLTAFELAVSFPMNKRQMCSGHSYQYDSVESLFQGSSMPRTVL